MKGKGVEGDMIGEPSTSWFCCDFLSVASRDLYFCTYIQKSHDMSSTLSPAPYSGQC
jgi:hypothetical protein